MCLALAVFTYVLLWRKLRSSPDYERSVRSMPHSQTELKDQRKPKRLLGANGVVFLIFALVYKRTFLKCICAAKSLISPRRADNVSNYGHFHRRNNFSMVTTATRGKVTPWRHLDCRSDFKLSTKVLLCLFV